MGLVLVSFLTDLIGAGNDAWELVLLLPLAFQHGLENRRVVGSQIDEDMGDAALINVSIVFDHTIPGTIPPKELRKKQKMPYKPWETISREFIAQKELRRTYMTVIYPLYKALYTT